MKVQVSPLLEEDLDRVAAGTLKKHCLAFCSYLAVTSYHLGLCEADDYLHVSSRVERQIYTTRWWGPMLGALRQIGALEESPQDYIVGARTKAYRLATRYHDGIREIDIYAPDLARRVGEAARGTGPQTPAHLWLRDVYLDRTTLDASVTEVLQELDDMLALDPEDDSAVLRRASVRYQYEQFINKNPKFDVHAESGRVCYIPNLLAKSLRAKLLIDGEPTVEVDVSASQPRLLLTFYSDQSCVEAQAFAELLDSGQFYSSLGEWVAYDFDHKSGKTDAFREVFYGPLRMHGCYPMWHAFAARFPNLACRIEIEKAKSRSEFPIRMQKLEADIMIDGVATECRERSIPLVSIHDGVRVKTSDADLVEDIIRKHWALKTGRQPKIKNGKRPDLAA